ncbi:MAG TPA: hypothetical protein VHM00_10040 [Caldimonas sp.]|jgi:hypothetical protein|nr:hypothetical protein [Caldimonas sp.]HEX2541409.1 hypothetical protein [Caldimonas sp.]
MAAALAVAAVAILLIVAARQVTLLVLDVPDRRATLVVKRSPALGMRLIESESSLCGRQGPGSPLFSLSLPTSLCPFALAKGPAASGRNLLLSLPFSRTLHGWAG